ncbi:transposase [Salmonella enterica]|nr:hypothetical protein [Salmonella enterica]EDK2264262.1 hypothetical protein [Salmonella enterica subsp. enterica serovar Muenchen]EDJ5491121.1 hypothetical protein [Salmonella enterica]EHU4525754.1 transposase [Salmonella enterica]EHV4070092.1 transposase [Salmonella enterica]
MSVKPVAIQAFLLNVVLHYLLPYSPSLNPIKRLWKVINERVGNTTFLQQHITGTCRGSGLMY